MVIVNRLNGIVTIFIGKSIDLELQASSVFMGNKSAAGMHHTPS